MPETKPRFIYVTYIDTTPEKLWRALTDPALIRPYWLDRRDRSAWKKGAPLESHSPDGELEWAGRVVEARAPWRLVYTFQPVDAGESASRVTFEVERLRAKGGPQGRALRLTVTHDRFPRGSKVHPGVTRGWPAILSGLKSLLETGDSLGLSWKS